MSLNSVPDSERLTIAIFGKCNSGKSMLVNAITNQNMSIVSHIKGTTTDIVKKNMELKPLGAVTIIDTAGFDDDTTLGKLRVNNTIKIASICDIAIFVSDNLINNTAVLDNKEQDFIKTYLKSKQNLIIVFNNKTDNSFKNYGNKFLLEELNLSAVVVNALKNLGVEELKNLLGKTTLLKKEKKLVADLVSKNDIVILVTPIDESAPKGRLILPQQQTIRELLEIGAITIVVEPSELEKTLKTLNTKPKLVICDSQAFKIVNDLIPKDISLTSFSILFARKKGDFNLQMESLKSIDSLNDDDIILIAEGCTHHKQCNDIGSVQIPNILKRYTNKNLKFVFTGGSDFNIDKNAKLVIHCGACMLSDNQMNERINLIKTAKIPMTNYGMVLAYCNGIINRCKKLFD